MYRAMPATRLLWPAIAIFLFLIVFCGLVYNHPARSAALVDHRVNDVFNATLGFQKIFVINIPSRFDRRDSMSLAASFTGLDVEYMDAATSVANNTLPPGAEDNPPGPGERGCWRSHMNFARKMVEENIQSALVLEDDADWDIRLKVQMNDFAKASRLLVQPLPGTKDQFLDPTNPRTQGGEQQRVHDFDLDDHTPAIPKDSPYGDLDRWDLLWLGHCGTRFPGVDNPRTPLGRIMHYNDETVPEPQHLNMQFGTRELPDKYPAHTRAVSRAAGNACTLGYALSLPGARKVLYELGIHEMHGPVDMGLRGLCAGKPETVPAVCLSIQPQLFQHHRPVGDMSTFSDISAHDGYNHHAFTRNVRWSVRVNFDRLIRGVTDYIDIFRDGEPKNQDIGN